MLFRSALFSSWSARCAAAGEALLPRAPSGATPLAGEARLSSRLAPACEEGWLLCFIHRRLERKGAKGAAACRALPSFPSSSRSQGALSLPSWSLRALLAIFQHALLVAPQLALGRGRQASAGLPVLGLA